MESDPGQVGGRSHSHDCFEGVLQRALAHPRGLAEVRQAETIAGVCQGVVLGDLDDSTLG
jgi:hypothetical protein